MWDSRNGASDIAKNESDDFNNAAIVTRAVASVPIQNALQTLIDFQNITKPTAVPLAVIRAIYSILPSSELSQLDKAVSNASFVFSDPLSFVDETTVESRRFKKRMDRLRLRAEDLKSTYDTAFLLLVVSNGPCAS